MLRRLAWPIFARNIEQPPKRARHVRPVKRFRMRQEQLDEFAHAKSASKGCAVSLPKYAARRDGNESAIVDALQDIGAQVERMSKPCDLLVRFRGQVHVLEIDNPESKYRKREKAQLDFLRDWQVPLIQTIDDAFRAIGASRME